MYPARFWDSLNDKNFSFGPHSKEIKEYQK